MNKKYLEAILYSAGGIIALAVILITVNFIISSLNLRVDMTQGSVYTLSPATNHRQTAMAPIATAIFSANMPQPGCGE